MSSGIYAINTSKHILSERNVKIMYFTLVHAHLLYVLYYLLYCEVVRTLRSSRGHLMNTDNHLFYYVPGSHSNNKIDGANHRNVAGILGDNFKMASNSTHNVHYGTPFIQSMGSIYPQERMRPILFCSWNMKSGCHQHQIGKDCMPLSIRTGGEFNTANI